MIVDYIDPQYLPDFVVWLDWQLYTHGHMWVLSTLIVLAWRSMIKIEHRVSVPVAIILNTLVFAMYQYLFYGAGVG